MYTVILNAFRYLDVLKLPSRVARIKYFLLPMLYLSLLIAMSSIAIISLSFPIILILSVLFSIIIGVLAIISEIILKIKRLHDINYSAWWLLLALVPLLNIAFELALLFTRGTIGKNKFGPETKKATKLEYILTIFFIPIRIFLFAIFIFYKKL